MAIRYPSTLPCPLVEGSEFSPGETFIRSQFDYDIRQRPVCTKQYQVKFTFLFDSSRYEEGPLNTADTYYENGGGAYSVRWSGAVYPGNHNPIPVNQWHVMPAYHAAYDYEFRVQEANPIQGIKYAVERRLALPTSLIKQFREFYYTTLNRGVLPFEADWNIEGVYKDGVRKEFRFASMYKPEALGNGQWKVTAIFDLLTPIESL